MTPEAVVGLLRAMRDRPGAAAFREALPVAGESGSLRRRFVDTPAAGRIRAKTGYIENVYSLSGYLTTLDGRDLAFSVIVNQTGGEGAVSAIDRLIVGLVEGRIRDASDRLSPRDTSASRTSSPSPRGPGGRRRARRGALARPLGGSRARRESSRAAAGSAWRVELGDQPVVVRHYRRGGWMGPLLDDRYFDRPPRPFAELAVSESLRAAGVPTPASSRPRLPARPGYRADLVTEWLSPGLDLEELLRPGLYPDAERAAAVETAGRTVGRAHGAGLDHPDQARNLFLQPLGAPASWDAALLDLDRARIAPDDLHRVEIKKTRALRAIPREGATRGRVSWEPADEAAFRRGYDRA